MKRILLAAVILLALSPAALYFFNPQDYWVLEEFLAPANRYSGGEQGYRYQVVVHLADHPEVPLVLRTPTRIGEGAISPASEIADKIDDGQAVQTFDGETSNSFMIGDEAYTVSQRWRFGIGFESAELVVFLNDKPIPRRWSDRGLAGPTPEVQPSSGSLVAGQIYRIYYEPVEVFDLGYGMWNKLEPGTEFEYLGHITGQIKSVEYEEEPPHPRDGRLDRIRVHQAEEYFAAAFFADIEYNVESAAGPAAGEPVQ